MPKRRFMDYSASHRRRICRDSGRALLQDDISDDGRDDSSEAGWEEVLQSSNENLSVNSEVPDGPDDREVFQGMSDIASANSSSDSDESSEEEPVTFMEEMRQWASSDVTHSKVSEILKILRKHHCFSHLPVDARTLLSTPRATPVQRIAGGSYHHCGIEKKLLLHLEKYPQLLCRENLKMQCCIDGLPLAKSSNSQLWPILMAFQDFPKIDLFTVGIYHGHSKPTSVSQFLSDLKDELCGVLTNGIDHRGKKYHVEMSAFIFDTPAYSFATQTVPHTAYYSCRKCITKGEYERTNVAFLELHAELRTDTSFRRREQEEHHRDISPLEEIPGIDMIAHFPYDYMHLTCLGVMRKMLSLFMAGPLLVRLPSISVSRLSEQLEWIASSIPMEFARKPRGVRELKRWKATEFRQLMLYTGPFVLRKIVGNDVLVHYLCFNYAMRCFVGDKYVHQRNEARKLMEYFVQNFKTLYGRRSVSHNVHALLHVHTDAEHYGSLEVVSSFKFEDKLQSIKRMVRKNEKPLQQIVRREAEVSIKDTKGRGYCTSISRNVEALPLGLMAPAYTKISLKNFTVSVKTPDNCVLIGRSIVIVSCIATLGEITHVCGCAFKDVSDFYAKPRNSSNVGLYRASELSEPRIWPIQEIVAKAIMIPFTGKDRVRQFFIGEIIHR